VWGSKNIFYETPWDVTGISKLAGSKKAPKGIYTQIGLTERRKALDD
jgi:hypothetical protein